MKRAVLIVAYAAGFAAATWYGGWWGLLGLALLIGAAFRTLPPWLVGTAAALAWLGLILQADRHGSLGRLAARLGGMLDVPGWTIVAVSGGWAFLAAWSGARLGACLSASAEERNR